MLLRAVLQAGHSMFDAMTHASDLKVRLVRQEMFEYTFWVDLFLVDTLFSLYVPAADYRFLAVDPWISVPTTCWYKVQGLQFLQFTGTLNLMWSKHMNRNCDWWCSVWILPSKNPGFNSNNIKKKWDLDGFCLFYHEENPWWVVPPKNFRVEKLWPQGGADSVGGRGPEWRDLQQRGEDQTLEGWVQWNGHGY